MPTLHTAARTALGLLFLSHALAHAVLPMRGVLDYSTPTPGSVVAIGAYSIALVTLFAAGVGLIGSPLLARHVMRLAAIGLTSSVVALLLARDSSGWSGLAFDAALGGALVGLRNVGGLTLERRASASQWRRHGRRLTDALACGLVGYVALGTILWPWHRRWGTTAADWALSLPGDPVQRTPQFELMHAVTIDAPPDAVWQWLVQIGQDRAGFYSYDWLERLFLADVHNVFELRGAWQPRAAGDFVRAAPPNYLGGLFGQDVGWNVTYVERGRAMVLEGWGAFVLEPAPANRTRFLIRSSMSGRDTPAWGAGLTFAWFEMPHFIMERKMMLTLKECAEREFLASLRENPRSGFSN